MGILDKVIDAATGGLGSSIVSIVEKYFPPDMSPEQRANIALAADNLALQRTIALNAAQADAERAVNERIAAYEGTASDLKSLPFIGSVLLFARGAQRPVWGFATLYLDYGVFSGAWTLSDPVVANAFWIVNFLVLGFLFGERAVMNVLPAFTALVQAKSEARK